MRPVILTAIAIIIGLGGSLAGFGFTDLRSRPPLFLPELDRALAGFGMFLVAVGLLSLGVLLIRTIRSIKPPILVLEVHVDLQPFDIQSEATKSPKTLDTITGGIDDTQHIAETIAKRAAEIIQPERSFETTLQISGSSLRSPDHLEAAIHIIRPYQMGPIRTEFGGAESLDFLHYFEDHYVFLPEYNCIGMSIDTHSGYFTPEYLRIYRRDGDFSFEAEDRVVHKDIRFNPRQSKIVVAVEKGGGAPSEILESKVTSLAAALRRSLPQYDFLAVSPLTREDLQRKRQEVITLEPSLGKARLVSQYNVDFILGASLIVNTIT